MVSVQCPMNGDAFALDRPRADVHAPAGYSRVPDLRGAAENRADVNLPIEHQMFATPQRLRYSYAACLR